MEMRNYWVALPPGRQQQRFAKAAKNKVTCWTIDVDTHELGLRSVSDAEFTESLYQPGQQEQGVFLP